MRLFKSRSGLLWDCAHSEVIVLWTVILIHSEGGRDPGTSVRSFPLELQAPLYMFIVVVWVFCFVFRQSPVAETDISLCM